MVLHDGGSPLPNGVIGVIALLIGTREAAFEDPV
jgi:hypothetical protein